MAWSWKWKRTWRGPQDTGFVACCGEACDERCRELAIRDRHLGRRMSTAGVLRVV
jgi:hypothetical protein